MKHMNIFFFSALLLVSLCFFHEIPAQEKSEIKDSVQQIKSGKRRTILDWKNEQDSLYRTEKLLPTNLQRMGRSLREVITRMKESGVTRANVKQRNVDKTFSMKSLEIDSLGRISIEVNLKRLDQANVDQWLSWGVRIKVIVYPENKVGDNVVTKLKSIGTTLIKQNSKNYVSVSCAVPFDTMEQFAKLSTILGLDSFFPTEQNIGNWEIDSLKYKAGHIAHQRYLDSMDVEFRKLSPPLRKLETPLLDLLKKVEDHGITRLNVKTEVSQKFFLKNNIHADTFGRIRVDIYLRNLKKSAYDSIVTSGAKIIDYVCDDRDFDQAVVNDLRAHDALVDQFANMSYETMTAFVQFDAFANIAKISSVLQIKFPPE